MSKIYGNFWSEDQVVIANAYQGEIIPHCIFKGEEGAPAFLAVCYDMSKQIIEHYLFVEIIPNTERKERFLNGISGVYEYGVCVKVNIYTGPSYKFEDMSSAGVDSWPLAWFKLDQVPVSGSVYAAYDRAMSVVGG